MKVLVLNAGSSSLKGAVIDSRSGVRLAQASVERGSESDEQALLSLIDRLEYSGTLDAVGHRVVHGRRPGNLRFLLAHGRGNGRCLRVSLRCGPRLRRFHFPR